MKLKNGTWVVVADGEKFLLLRNNVDEEFLDLRVIGGEELINPPAREHATDRPGRMPDEGPGSRSALQETDWHRLEKERFARELGTKLERWAEQGRFSDLVVVADPHSLGELRGSYGAHTKSRLNAEIAKDFTNLPINELEKALSTA